MNFKKANARNTSANKKRISNFIQGGFANGDINGDIVGHKAQKLEDDVACRQSALTNIKNDEVVHHDRTCAAVE